MSQDIARKQPTKAELICQLADANAMIAEKDAMIAALVALVDAVNDATYSAPIGAAGTSDRAELHRTRDMLSAIKVATDRRNKIMPDMPADWQTLSHLRTAANGVRREIAEPLEYAPYVKPEPALELANLSPEEL